MKTTSLSAFAALLGVAFALNLSALAGPDPQSKAQYSDSKRSEPKTTATFALTGHKATTTSATTTSRTTKQTTETAPKLVPVSGPHGTTYNYVW